jgi:hypothetical protein
MYRNTRVIPYLPQRGRQHAGCAPLTPDLTESFKNVLAQRGPDEVGERPPEVVGLLIFLIVL